MSESNNTRISRREALKRTTLLAAGLVTLPALMMNRAVAATDSKTAVQYRPQPNGEQRCDRCVHFIGGGTTLESRCEIVEGTVSPHGWCTAFTER